MANDWYYLRNFFDSVTKNSFRRMNVMARDHHDKLKVAAASNPQVDALYQFFLPAYQAFNDSYSSISSIRASYSGYTMMLENLFQQLNFKAKEWDIKIQNVYIEGTPEYQMILPNRRIPFQSGSYESRINELTALIQNLNAFPTLSTVSQDVQTFLNQLNQVRTTQQGKEKEESDASFDLENKRAALARTMHAVWAGLLNIYYENPQQVKSFYEMKFFQISSSGETTTNYITYNLPSGNNLSILEGEVDENTIIIIQNNGNAPIDIFSSNSKTNPLPNNAVRLQPQDKQEFYLIELGDGSPENTLNVINVYNVTGQTASFKVATVKIDNN